MSIPSITYIMYALIMYKGDISHLHLKTEILDNAELRCDFWYNGLFYDNDINGSTL